MCAAFQRDNDNKTRKRHNSVTFSQKDRTNDAEIAEHRNKTFKTQLSANTFKD